MTPRAASLGQLAVACRLLSDGEHQRLRRVLQVRAREGRPVSFAKLLIKAGFGSKTVRRLLRLGAGLACVRCDGCLAEVPTARLPDRREVPCERCGALLLGFAAFRRREPGASSLGASAEQLPLLDLSAALAALEARGPAPASTPGSSAAEEDEAPQGTVLFRGVLDLPAQAEADDTTIPFTDVISLPAAGRAPRSEEETLVAFRTLLLEPRRAAPASQGAPAAPPPRAGTGRVTLKDPLAARKAAPEPGGELGGWRIEKELGEGGVGKVFLAARDGRRVALKVLKPETLTDQEYVARFRREAEAASRIRHPHIVGVVESGRDAASGLEFIAYELVEGGSLLDRLAERGRLDEREALGVARGIALALAEAEAQGIVHRDVKPENILLARDGTAKLADLGLIRQLGRANLRLTAPGIVVGTPCYMAPEQALGEEGLDVRADIYGLGLCVWQSLTGAVPFDEEDELPALELMTRHIEEDVPDVRLERPSVSDGAAQVVRHMTARRKEDRYPSPAALVRDLDLVLAGGLPLGPRAPVAGRPPSAPTGRALGQAGGGVAGSGARAGAGPGGGALAGSGAGSSAERRGAPLDPPSARRPRPGSEAARPAPTPAAGAAAAGRPAPPTSPARPAVDLAPTLELPAAPPPPSGPRAATLLLAGLLLLLPVACVVTGLLAWRLRP